MTIDLYTSLRGTRHSSQKRRDISPLSPQSSTSSLNMKKSTDSLKSQSQSPRPEVVGRSSFCSVRENDSDLAQTFTSSKVSSYAHDHSRPDPQPYSPGYPPHTEAVEDSCSSVDGSDGESLEYRAPLTQPHSKLHGYLYPADSFKGWKEIKVRGKAASRSYSDLKVLNFDWMSPPIPRKPERHPPGQSPMERLPYELLKIIVDQLVIDIPTHGVTARNVDLMSLLMTSRTMHATTLNTLYNHVTIPHSKIFRKFLTHIREHPSVGTLVRRLDFCHFNPSTIFSTARERAAAVNLTSDTLVECLRLTPFLQEFLAQEYLDDDLDNRVLKKLLFGLPRLQALDFCGCSSRKFKEAFQSVLMTPMMPSSLPIRRLSFHKCISLPHTVYETFMPRLPELTHLDVAGTQMTDIALLSIPKTAKLTHLNLAKCSRLTARGVIDFLANHPAAKSLVFLSLGTDARSSQLLDKDDLTELLPKLPVTLKSLTLKGSKMSGIHIPLLRPLVRHLEELALGRCLELQDIDRLFIPDEPEPGSMEVDWTPHTLRYLDVSDISPQDFDYSYLYGPKSAILKKVSAPLEVIEVSDPVLERLKKLSTGVERAGWTPKEFQSRSWVVRHPSKFDGPRDDGSRPWKVGASFWGMRKVPMALMDVGGMYGSYMFGRKL